MKPIPLLSVTLTTAALALSALAADKKFSLKTKPYPMTTCLVSGEKLDSMGDPFVFVEDGQEIQLCCKDCQKDFAKDKKAFLAKVQEAARKVKAYPANTCIVSDEPLESDKAVGMVVEGREFVFCCKSCVKDFKKDQAKFVKKFDAAVAKPKS